MGQPSFIRITDCQQESFKRYYKNADRIVRINTYIHEKDKNTQALSKPAKNLRSE
jgi:hypothetical protein